jgi:hypothetical protein
MVLPVAASLDEAHAAIDLWEFYKRRTLDPGQRLDVEVMLATRSDGLWAADVTGHEKPRQNGKGDSVEVVELWGLTQRSERILHTIHDAVLLATETQSRMLSLLEGHADLRRLISRSWRGTGQQMIELRNGGIVWYRTRTGGGARGVDEVDRVVVDEAQHAELEHLSAITPTQAVSANPQLNALGTGALDGKSGWWWSLRKQAKHETPARFGYVGFSAQRWEIEESGQVVLGDVDPTERATWWATNEALHTGRISEEYLDRQLRILGPSGFAQEHLCVWAPPVDDGVPTVIPMADWKACAGETGPLGAVAFALDVSPARTSSSISVAGKSNLGGMHVELVDRRSGTDWLVARAKKLQDDHGGVLAVAAGSPAASLLIDMEAAGVAVLEVSTADHAKACGLFFDAVVQHDLHHLDQAELNVAVAGAAQKFYGDSWLWGRRQSEKNTSVDITPVISATLAMWAASQLPEEAMAPPEVVLL